MEEIKHLTQKEREEACSHTRYDFITHVHNEISKPITQHRKQLDYIPTQIIAEYLREHFECDAIIYKSSLFQQTSRHTGNIALFHKGIDFVRVSNSVVEYVRHEIKRIDDVAYVTSSDDEF